MPLFRRRGAPDDSGGYEGSAAETLRPLLEGNLPVDQWPPDSGGGEPWSTFVRARSALAADNVDEAITLWRELASRPDLESRHYLQAWSFLRANGVLPPEAQTHLALGVMVEVPVGGAHDTLVAYADRTSRYLNHAGGAAVVEDATPDIAEATAALVEAGQALALNIGPWEHPSLPPLPASAARLTVLTPSGPHFGQASFPQLANDPMAKPVIDAALNLVQLIVGATT